MIGKAVQVRHDKFIRASRALVICHTKLEIDGSAVSITIAVEKLMLTASRQLEKGWIKSERIAGGIIDLVACGCWRHQVKRVSFSRRHSRRVAES